MSYFSAHVKNGMLPLVLFCIALSLVAMIVFGPSSASASVLFPDGVVQQPFAGGKPHTNMTSVFAVDTTP